MPAAQTTPLPIHKERVPDSFDHVAASYDLLCKLNPGYEDHLRRSAARLDIASESRVLDLCCGTGLSTAALLAEHPAAHVTGLDASAGMLDVARAKPELGSVRFVEGDATDPAAAGAEGPFDAILMAYGLRNLSEPDRCLANLHALLAPGGTLCLHEYSVADSRISRAVWNAVTLGIVIPLAAVVVRRTELFRYLRRSVLAFDGRRALEARLRSAGFDQVETLPMGGWQRGIVHTFRARRPAG